MTEEEIQEVRESDDPEEAAMEFVRQGEATLIEFSRDHIIGTCGKEKRNLETTNADDVGGWSDFAGLVNWDTYVGDGLCPDGPMILPGTPRDEAVVTFIDQDVVAALEAVREVGPWHPGEGETLD